QNDTLIVGCESRNGKVTVKHEPNMTNKYKPVLYEDYSHFAPKHALCAVTIDKFNKFLVNVVLKSLNIKSILKFYPVNSASTPNPIKFTGLPHGQIPYSSNAANIFAGA
ncbi:hypothetical protein PFISCL1PPCAC_25167, partial [Pristionchus fissidentatus]